jgi:serine/threonine protein kinase/Flp pilus assembly protein TadD
MTAAALDIPNIRLLDPIGKGGAGTVYLAEQLQPLRKVAIKIVSPDSVPAEFMKLLKAEGDVAAQFDHDNLLTVYGCGIVDDHYYQIMPLLPGGDLDARMAAGLSPAESVDIVMQAAAGLGHIHRRGYVHRDIKPGNILFSRKGRPVLADFGIAKAIDSVGVLTQLGCSSGTPRYMSPEQILGKPVDGRTDLYSLGIVFYELLTGKPPFTANSDFDLRKQQVEQSPPPLPVSLSRYQPVLDRMLAKDPAERFADAEALEEALGHLSPVTDEVTQIMPDSGLAGPGSRKSNLAILLTIAVLASVTLFIVGNRDRHSDPEAQPVPSITPLKPEIDPRSLAILPFTDDSEASENAQFLANGIHQDLLTMMAKISGLSVISQTSVDSYRGSNKKLRDIARELGVAQVLEGGVRRSGDSIRVNVQLIDASDDHSLWAESYDRALNTRNIFAIQTGIAEQIALTLAASLTQEESVRIARVPTENFEAYVAFLKGNEAMDGGSRESANLALEYYREAIRLEPGFARAYTALGWAYGEMGEYFGVSQSEVSKRQREYAQQALKLDDSEVDAYVLLGIQARSDGDFLESESLLRTALTMAPGNANASNNLALTLRLQGRLTEALEHYDRAIVLNPLATGLNESRGSALRDLARFDDALNQYQIALELDPGFPNTYWGIATVHWSLGRPDRAIEWFENAARLTPDDDMFPAWLALMHLELGEDDLARSQIDQALRFVPTEQDSDTLLARELMELYQGGPAPEFPDARRYMSRVWYGSLTELPERAMIQGQHQQAVDYYQGSAVGLAEGSIDIDGANYRAAIDLAFSLKQLGEDHAAEALLDAAEAHISTIPRLGIRGFWVSDARILAIRGRRQACLQALKNAVGEGWRNLWRFYLYHDPVLEPFREEPEFKAIVAKIEAEMAKLRDGLAKGQVLSADLENQQSILGSSMPLSTKSGVSLSVH